MKKYFLILPIALALLGSSFSAFAMDSPTAHHDTFEAYEIAMTQKSLPKILVVGCGHGVEYGHSHCDSWCVNIENDWHPFSKHTPETFKRSVQYDELLDISTFHLPKREGTSRIPDIKNETLKRYKNKFDFVILERVTSATLDKPFTLWNAAFMLAPGGQLVIETSDYNLKLYNPQDSNLFSPLCKPYIDSFNNKIFSSEDIVQEKTQQFGLTSEHGCDFKLCLCSSMALVASFLSKQGFKDIMNANKAHSPFSKNPNQKLEETPLTSLLCTTKTQETDNMLNEWANQMYSIKGFVMEYGIKRK